MFFNKNKEKKNDLSDIDIAICMLLIHAARTDERYEVQEKKIIKSYFTKFSYCITFS